MEVEAKREDYRLLVHNLEGIPQMLTPDEFSARLKEAAEKHRRSGESRNCIPSGAEAPIDSSDVYVRAEARTLQAAFAPRLFQQAVKVVPCYICGSAAARNSRKTNADRSAPFGPMRQTPISG